MNSSAFYSRLRLVSPGEATCTNAGVSRSFSYTRFLGILSFTTHECLVCGAPVQLSTRGKFDNV